MQTPRERRSSERAAQRLLKRDLNDAQLDTLAAIERFGWELKFVRRPPFQPVIPVVFDGGGGNVPKPATQAEVEALAAARKACPYR